MIANENNYPQIGTLGCKVIDRDSGDHLILSNWHVLYGRSDASNGEAVLQPSGKSNVIGHTIKGVINSRVDCAVASLDGIRGIDDGLLEIQGQVNGSADAYVGMKVIKSGLTGIAKGIVDGRTDITLHFPFGVLKFDDQWHIAPRDGDNFLVDEGDSGSVWISEDDNAVVGLHFAGIRNESALANPIGEVIDELNAIGIRIRF